MVHQALVVRVVWVQQVLQDRVAPLVVEHLALQVHQDPLGQVAQQEGVQLGLQVRVDRVAQQGRLGHLVRQAQ